MADNTIIKVPQPKFGINEIVYFRESALLGYLEPAKVRDTLFDPQLNKTFYVFEYKRNQPNTQIAGDAIDLKRAKVISVVEDEIISFSDALNIKLTTLESEVLKAKSQIAASIGKPVIDVAEQTGDITAPLEFGDVSVGSLLKRTYTITNSGDADLNLSGSPLVAVLADNNDFVVDAQPSSIIDPNDGSNFVIRFAPSEAGRRVGVIQILNNDVDSPILSFSVEGNGV